ncbi:unnamed protein product [Caenorhabditis auriculariae]|uniref:Uncharacterized protein n=1 Tax=Caenorhabditis auriculariae TaxID=2777116 RepID=A0A8S1H3K6_9PELO|nr:unnamed protein product [Caenorhabditis auriculariae]
MDDDLIDFLLIFGVVIILIIITVAAIALNASRITRFLTQLFRRILRRKNSASDLEHSSTHSPPRRRTIRIAKSVPSNVGRRGILKQPVRRASSNPPAMGATVPDGKQEPNHFVLIFPKPLSYHNECQSPVHPPLADKLSWSTKSSYLPSSVGAPTTRRCSF